MIIDREQFLAAALAASLGSVAGCGSNENPPAAAPDTEPTAGAEQQALTQEPAPAPAAAPAPAREPVPEVQPVGPTVE